jgi:lipopolysaccharide transport system permease protein
LRSTADVLALAWPLAKRDLLARYRGSLAGLGWALLVPLAMLVLYTLVFQGVFKARWPGAGQGGSDYALHMFAGLMVFTATADVAVRAVRLMIDHANLVKRVVFPLDVLAVALVMQSAVHAALQTLVLVALVLALGEGARAGWWWLPAIWLWVLVLQLGLAWLLAATGCYVRDLQHLLPPLIGGLIFLSPVFYAVDSAPEALRWLLALNPLTMPMQAMRAALFGTAVDSVAVGWAVLLAVAFALLSRWWFERLRPGFADLL